MAEIEALDHSGIAVASLRDSEQFYQEIFGVGINSRVGFDSDSVPRGRSIHSDVSIGSLGLALMVPNDRMPMPSKDELRGSHPFRHGFSVSRHRFGSILEKLKVKGAKFAGPISHPEESPLGESLYFQDPGGNFLEICWRRDARLEASKQAMKVSGSAPSAYGGARRASLPGESDLRSQLTGHGKVGESVDEEDTSKNELAERFSHIAVAVTDLEKSESWYREVLGLDYIGRNLTAEEKPHSVLTLNSGQLFLLVQHESVVPRRPGSRAVHHAFMLTPNQYRAAHERFGKLGYDVGDNRQQFRAVGDFCIDMYDPDGHHYQVECHAPEATEILLPGVGVVDCGPAESYRTGDVKLFKEGNFYLVRLPEGFLALSRWCMHMNGLVAYQEVHWRFWCPMHGATYDRRGNPTGRFPDTCALRLNSIGFSPDGRVLVDTDKVIERKSYHPDQAARPPQSSPSGLGAH